MRRTFSRRYCLNICIPNYSLNYHHIITSFNIFFTRQSVYIMLYILSYLILGLLKKVGFVKREGPDGGLSLNDSDLIV